MIVVVVVVVVVVIIIIIELLQILRLCIGVRRRGKGRRALALPQIREKYFSGKNHVKFGHFVISFGHISCKIRAFC